MTQILPPTFSVRRCILIVLCALAFVCQSLTAQTWSPKPEFPSAEGGDGSVVFAIGHKIYIGGGFGTKKFYEYNTLTNTWVQKADLPGVYYSRCFGTGFVINGKGYMGLGLDISEALGAYCKKDMWEYDPVADTWSQKSSFPGEACDGHFSFVIDDVAYIGGGELLHGPSRTQMYAFDPVSDTWTPKASYPIAPGITSPFSFTAGDNGYVSCGMQTDGDSVWESKSTFVYSPLNDQWTPKADFGGANRQAGVSILANNRILCGWGFQDKGIGIYYNDFYEYDYHADRWTKAFESSVPSRGFASAITAENGSVYLGIGWRSGNVLYDWHELQLQPTDVDSDESSEVGKAATTALHTGDYLWIGGRGEPFSFHIYSSSGDLIKQGTSSENKLSVCDLPRGLYIVRVTFNESTRHVMIVR